ncbi:MAG: glutathione S-transferase N-terminal domain-containing protein [Candidatus Competibacterales bacterium]|nr:glutathione S-transferase N-terminal domain-containing protein [Candidatus Competibacterales bacterium]
MASNRRGSILLYASPTCCWSHRVRLALAEKGVAVDILDVDALHPPEDLLALNPYGSVPTLVDRDLVLYDSRVIMEYIDERFPYPPLLPSDPINRGRSRLVLTRVEQDWYSLLEDLESVQSERCVPARKALAEGLAASAEVFAAKPFFLSEEPSLVDCSLGPLLWRLEHYRVELPRQALSVLQYAERLFERAPFQHSLSEQERRMVAT